MSNTESKIRRIGESIKNPIIFHQDIITTVFQYINKYYTSTSKEIEIPKEKLTQKGLTIIRFKASKSNKKTRTL